MSSFLLKNLHQDFAQDFVNYLFFINFNIKLIDKKLSTKIID